MQYYNITCPHCRHLTYNNKPNCSNCGLLLSKTHGCICDYCKRVIRKYESVLKAALKFYYHDKCNFPDDEAKMWAERVVNDLEVDNHG